MHIFILFYFLCFTSDIRETVSYEPYVAVGVMWFDDSFYRMLTLRHARESRTFSNRLFQLFPARACVSQSLVRLNMCSLHPPCRDALPLACLGFLRKWRVLKLTYSCAFFLSCRDYPAPHLRFFLLLLLSVSDSISCVDQSDKLCSRFMLIIGLWLKEDTFPTSENFLIN